MLRHFHRDLHFAFRVQYAFGHIELGLGALDVVVRVAVLVENVERYAVEAFVLAV